VDAPSTQIQVGQKFTITGTVLDMSPAQSGTAAISEKDMSAWMEYLHKQLPKPTNATGVTVDLIALDPNGNMVYIGQATSNIDGTFGYSWAPEVPGLYQITAIFAGSASYGSSTASTFLTAVEGPVTPSPSPQPLASTADMYFVPAIAGLFVLIIAVAIVLALLMLRKRP
jgi:hypothetical protein